MEIKAKANFIRTSPRKVRLVVDLIRGMTANAAANQLKFINKRAAKPVAKLLNSAIANAGHNYEIEQDNLYIKEIRVDEGPSLHRWTPRAQGRATPIKKRSSHIILVLAEIAESGKVQPKKRKIEAPVKFDRKPKEDEGVKVEDKKDTQTEKETEDHEAEEKDKRMTGRHEEGKGKHAKIEGKGFRRGFAGKIFRRKSG